MMQDLMQTLGYTFRNPLLLKQALTHPSAAAQKSDNQRLEFLGDAVLEYIVSDILYARYPDAREGKLTHTRQLMVCERTLSKIADGLGIGDALILDRGEQLTGGRTRPSILCDAMEAVLAAVYLDGGMEAARSLVERCWPDPDSISLPVQDGKSGLQEYLQRDGSPAPTYEILNRVGPDHDVLYEAAVYHMDRELARGKGKSKKQAEQDAACNALKALMTHAEST